MAKTNSPTNLLGRKKKFDKFTAGLIASFIGIVGIVLVFITFAGTVHGDVTIPVNWNLDATTPSQSVDTDLGAATWSPCINTTAVSADANGSVLFEYTVGGEAGGTNLPINTQPGQLCGPSFRIGANTSTSVKTTATIKTGSVSISWIGFTPTAVTPSNFHVTGQTSSSVSFAWTDQNGSDNGGCSGSVGLIGIENVYAGAGPGGWDNTGCGTTSGGVGFNLAPDAHAAGGGISYQVCRSETGVAAGGCFSTTGSTYTDSDPALKPGHYYSYAINALDGYGTATDPSDPITVYINPPEGNAPTNLHQTSSTASTIGVAWTGPNSKVPNSYRVSVMKNSTCQPKPGTACDAMPPAPPTKYDVPSSATSYTVTNLSAGSYQIWVDAVYSDYTSASNAITATTDQQPPTTPSGVKATSITRSTVSLLWKASKDNDKVSYYEVYRNGKLLAKVHRGLSYVDRKLKPNTKYSYDIVAVDLAGNHSAHSSVVKVKTK